MKADQDARVYGVGPALTPTATCLVLAILSAVPLPIPDYAAVAPNFLLMALYHWTLYRPDHLPYAVVFLIGLFFDLLTTVPGAAIGVTPLMLLIARSAVLVNRRTFIGKRFPYVWGGFAVLALSVNAGLWAASLLLNGAAADGRSFVFQAVLTVAGFPLATLVFARLQRATAAVA